jgi:hypothetical protein
MVPARQIPLTDDFSVLDADAIEAEILGTPFESSLFGLSPTEVIRPFEWPDPNFIVDILTNPSVMTDYSDPSDALFNIVLPLFIGPSETQPYLHQILLQYFTFAKAIDSGYRERFAALWGRRAALREEQRAIVAGRRSLPTEWRGGGLEQGRVGLCLDLCGLPSECKPVGIALPFRVNAKMQRPRNGSIVGDVCS